MKKHCFLIILVGFIGLNKQQALAQLSIGLNYNQTNSKEAGWGEFIGTTNYNMVDYGGSILYDFRPSKKENNNINFWTGLYYHRGPRFFEERGVTNVIFYDNITLLGGLKFPKNKSSFAHLIVGLGLSMGLPSEYRTDKVYNYWNLNAVQKLGFEFKVSESTVGEISLVNSLHLKTYEKGNAVDVKSFFDSSINFHYRTNLKFRRKWGKKKKNKAND